MTGRDRIIIQKVFGYIKDIISYTEGYTFDNFMSDKKTISACAFSIGQIGELAGNINADIREEYPDIPWRSIKGMRNKIVHDYENVDLAVLWGTIQNSLPQLAAQLENILEQQANNLDESQDEEIGGMNMS